MKRSRLVVRGLLASLLLPAMLLGWPALASAHIVRETNDLAAELHIPPNDHPLAGQPTTLQFTFASDNPKFALADCDCVVHAIVNQRSVASAALRIDNPETPLRATASLTFPAAGDYALVLTGTSRSGNFASFQLTYPAHVSPPLAKRSTAGIWLIAGLTVLLVAGGAIVVWLTRRR